MDSNNVLEKACNQESQNNKDFYSEWGTVQRILRCDTYFTNFATVAFKKVIETYPKAESVLKFPETLFTGNSFI